MAMIRVALENERRRLPVILAALGLTAIVVSLYGLDQEVGLLRLLRLDAPSWAQSEVTDQVPGYRSVAGTKAQSAGASSATMDPVVAEEASQRTISDIESNVPTSAQIVGVAANVSSSVLWWQTAQRLRQHLPASVQITGLRSLADGSFELQGLAVSAEHEALQGTVAAMREAGWRTHLTFWREHPEQPSAYLIRGAVDSDAPASPPEHTVIDVDEILQLAQRHAHAVGLTRLATLRPTHEDWAAGGTRIEQAISAVGSLDQVTAFGAALAGELQARLTRFDIESSEKGLVRVTASLDVLLRKETGR